MSTARRILVVALAAAAVALLPGSAEADDPVITDQPQDVVPPLVCVTTSAGPETCSTSDAVRDQLNDAIGRPVGEQVLEPSIDIVEGDLTTSGNDLVFSTRVVDVDAPALAGDERTSRHYAIRAFADGLEVIVWLDRHPARRDLSNVVVQDPKTYRYGIWTVPAVVDPATDTVTWRVPLAVLDDARAQACPTCPAFGRGTVLGDIRATNLARVETGVLSSPYSFDDAAAGRTYTIGER